MKIKFIIKLFLKRIISIEVLNILLRSLLKSSYIFPRIPKKIIREVPVSGIIDLQLPLSKKLYLEVDENDRTARHLYWEGIDGFEGETLWLFIELLKFTNVVLDIGANIGIYALIAAIDSPGRKIYAFEPVPRVFNYLKRNVELNRIDNLQIDCSAITNYNGEITLYVPSGVLPKSSSTLKGFKGNCEAISVRALTIDSFVTTNDIPKVDLIKIDTEATEHIVLESAKNVLERDKPLIICEVLKGKTEKFLQSLLDNINYKYFWISSEGLVEKEQIEGDATYKDRNYLFITKEKIQEIIEHSSAEGCASIFAKPSKSTEFNTQPYGIK